MNRLLGVSLRFALVLAAGCIGPPEVAVRDADGYEHGTAEVPDAPRAELWVSYQIVVVSIDGVPTDYRARRECVYFRVSLPPGEHELELRLDYSTPLHRIATRDELPLRARLEAGRAYRLLDLSAGAEGERRFTPGLLEGPPGEGSVGATAPSSISAAPSEGE